MRVSHVEHLKSRSLKHFSLKRRLTSTDSQRKRSRWWFALCLIHSEGHSCQTNQQGFALRRHSSCLLRNVLVVISGELLSSQLASLPPLMEGRQRRGKYNYPSALAAGPRFTAVPDTAVCCYGRHNPPRAAPPLFTSTLSLSLGVVVKTSSGGGKSGLLNDVVAL